MLLACFEAVQIFCIITCRFTLQSSKSCNDRQRPELDGHRHQKKRFLEVREGEGRVQVGWEDAETVGTDKAQHSDQDDPLCLCMCLINLFACTFA